MLDRSATVPVPGPVSAENTEKGELERDEDDKSSKSRSDRLAGVGPGTSGGPEALGIVLLEDGSGVGSL